MMCGNIYKVLPNQYCSPESCLWGSCQVSAMYKTSAHKADFSSLIFSPFLGQLMPQSPTPIINHTVIRDYLACHSSQGNRHPLQSVYFKRLEFISPNVAKGRTIPQNILGLDNPGLLTSSLLHIPLSSQHPLGQ